MFDWIADLFKKFSGFILDLLLYIPRLLYSLFVDVILYIMDLLFSIIPDFSQMNLSTIGHVSFLFCTLNLSTGFEMVCGAYVIRFIIRRLPVVG